MARGEAERDGDGEGERVGCAEPVPRPADAEAQPEGKVLPGALRLAAGLREAEPHAVPPALPEPLTQTLREGGAGEGELEGVPGAGEEEAAGEREEEGEEDAAPAALGQREGRVEGVPAPLPLPHALPLPVASAVRVAQAVGEVHAEPEGEGVEGREGVEVKEARGLPEGDTVPVTLAAPGVGEAGAEEEGAVDSVREALVEGGSVCEEEPQPQREGVADMQPPHPESVGKPVAVAPPPPEGVPRPTLALPDALPTVEGVAKGEKELLAQAVGVGLPVGALLDVAREDAEGGRPVAEGGALRESAAPVRDTVLEATPVLEAGGDCDSCPVPEGVGLLLSARL